MISIRKVLTVVLAGAMLFAVVPVVSLAQAPGIGEGTVDGAVLNGQHYSLNIIGVKNPKTADMTDSSGHVIFVDLNGKTKINLVEGDDFAVLDKNGTDGDGATFQLPDPGIVPYVVGEETELTDTITNYSIFVRPLGKPGGYAKITTCADVLESNLASFLEADDVEVLNEIGELGGVCSIESTGVLLREKGQSIFTNQTAALLTMVLKVEIYELQDTDQDPTTDPVLVLVDTVYVRVPIFDDMLENEYWEYDNNGLKLLQVRIYHVGTDVSNYDDPEAWDLLPLA